MADLSIKGGALSITELQQINFELAKPCPGFNQIGKITKEGEWNHIFNGITGTIQPRLTHLIKNLNASFEKLEQKGVKYFDPTNKNPTFIKKAEVYQNNLHLYFDIVGKIDEQLDALEVIPPALQKAYHELKCREIGLLYSLGEENGGFSMLKKPDEGLLAELTELAQEWKNKEKLVVDKTLNTLDLQQLEKLACYPEWLDIALEDPAYMKLVLNWALRDYNRVDVLVTCFGTVRRLKAAILPPYIGSVANPARAQPEFQVLAFQTVPTKVEGVSRRILTASIYHGSFKKFEPEKQERINILNPNEKIHFQRGHYTVTVEELLKECAEKNNREVNINLCADWGFVNFHPVKGVWNAEKQIYEMPAMTEENWTDQIPIARIETHEGLLAQYGDEVKDRHFFFKVMATRKALNLDALNCHSFWQLYLRMDDGNWKVLNIGFYAYRFQKGILDGLVLFCATLQRVVSLLDQNGSYIHRQRVGLPIFPTEKQGEQFIKRLHKWIHSNGVFQFLGRNCAYKIQEGTKKVIDDLPNFFVTSPTKSTMGVPFIDMILGWADRQAEWIRWLVMTILHTIFLSHRELVVQKPKGPTAYSVKKYLQEGHDIYNPAFLALQITEAHKTNKAPFNKGEIYWSHTDEKLYQFNSIKKEEVAKPPVGV